MPQIQNQALIEKYGSHQQRINDKGAFARRVLFIRNDQMGTPGRPPMIGDPHPNPFWQGLIVNEVNCEGIGKPDENENYAYWECEILYSTERTGLLENPRISIEYSVEALNTCCGRVWLNADGTPTPLGSADKIDVEDLPQTILYPLAEITLERTEAALSPNILTSLGTVNASAVLVPNGEEALYCAAETLLFEGPSTAAIYDAIAGEYIHYIAYKLLYRPAGHNMIWKPAKRRWDNEKGDWARDENGNYQYEGEGKWMRSDPANHETSDFSWLLPLAEG